MSDEILFKTSKQISLNIQRKMYRTDWRKDRKIDWRTKTTKYSYIPNYHIGTSIAMQLLVLKKMLSWLTKFVLFGPPLRSIIIDKKYNFGFNINLQWTILCTKTGVKERNTLYYTLILLFPQSHNAFILHIHPSVFTWQTTTIIILKYCYLFKYMYINFI